MMKSIIALIGLCSFFAFEEWQIIKSSDGILQFETPIAMNYSQDKALTSIGPINLHLYKSQGKDSLQNKYTVTYYELPVYLNMATDSMFIEMSKEIVESMLEYPGAKLDYTSIDPYKNGYSRSTRITYNDHYVAKTVIKSNGTHLVNAQCFVPKSVSLNHSVEKFLKKVDLKNLTHMK